MSTTTTPVEAGTTYPMPPRPSWADNKPDLTEGSIGWDRILCDDDGAAAVGVSRRDHITSECIVVGPSMVYLDLTFSGNQITPQQARDLAALLVQAADLAEQS